MSRTDGDPSKSGSRRPVRNRRGLRRDRTPVRFFALQDENSLDPSLSNNGRGFAAAALQKPPEMIILKKGMTHCVHICAFISRRRGQSKKLPDDSGRKAVLP